MKSKSITIIIVFMMLCFNGCSYLAKIKAKQGTLSLVLNLLVIGGIIACAIFMWWKKKNG